MDNNLQMYMSQADKRNRRNPGMAKERLRQEAIQEWHRSQNQHNKCWYCMDSPKVVKHLIICIGARVYLGVPQRRLLHPLQCFLTPIEHSLAVTKVDENVYEEIKVYIVC